MLFTKDEMKSIEEAVAQAEKKTSGEIVPLVVKSSGDYRWIHWLWGTLGWVLASTLIWLISEESVWFLHTYEMFALQALGGIIGSLVGRLGMVRRLTLPKSMAAERVHRECMANFVASGIQETRDRTGVLIYLSELEHRVEILADKGIHERCGNGYWEEQVKHILAGIRHGKACAGLCEAIEQIGEKLAENFPPREDDTNELPNTMLMGHQESEPSETE